MHNQAVNFMQDWNDNVKLDAQLRMRKHHNFTETTPSQILF